MDVVGLGMAKAAAKKLYAPQSSAFNFLSSRKWGALGDSITHRSTAAASRGYVDQIPKMAGTAYLSDTSFIEAGHPGETANQLLARYPAEIRAAGVKTLFLLVGTNDAGTGRTLAQYSADIMAIAAEAKRDGIPLIIGTVPPRGISVNTQPIRDRIDQYNTWLALWGPSAGVYIADIYSRMVNGIGAGSGATALNMIAGYDSGDGVHPNTIGHQIIAEAMVDAWSRVPKSTPFFVGAPASVNLMTNPLNAGTLGANHPTAAYEQPGGSGTAPTYALTAKSGNLRFGQWAEMRTISATTAGNRYHMFSCTAGGFSVGDTLLVTARVEWTDNAGNYRGFAWDSPPAANISLAVFNQLSVRLAHVLTESVLQPTGLILGSVVVPAGTTSITLAQSLSLPNGGDVTVRVGELGIFNATTLGLTNLI